MNETGSDARINQLKLKQMETTKIKDGYYTEPKTSNTVRVINGVGYRYSHETQTTTTERVIITSIITRWIYSEIKPIYPYKIK